MPKTPSDRSSQENAPMATAADFHPEVLRLFDRYVHGLIARRDFLSSATRYAAAGMTAASLLDALNPRFAHAQKVPQDDPRLKAEMVQYDSPKGYGQASGYLVRPANATGKLPGVLVIHENRGLNPHIEDIARRIALDNFVAFAPDALFTLGGYPGNEDKARELFPKLDQPKTREDFIAGGRAVADACSSERQDRRGGFLLRRRHRQLSRDAPAGTGSCRSLLRGRPFCRRRPEDQGKNADSLCRQRRTDQCRLAGLRRGAEEGRRQV
jgi:hypothetical protein